MDYQPNRAPANALLDGIISRIAMPKPNRMIQLVSREYKFMLDHLRFSDANESVAAFWSEFQQAFDGDAVTADGSLKVSRGRSVSFLDTSDTSFRDNGYLLRRREGDALEFTLKCRSADRFIAAGARIGAAKVVRNAAGVEYKRKLEEDIATPFVSRFSHSGTLVFRNGSLPDFGKTPKTVEECASLFPVIKTFQVNGRRIRRTTKVNRVNRLEAYERVYEGGTLHFRAKGRKDESVAAAVGVILWSLGAEGRPLVAEFSFKYKQKDGDFNRQVAIDAKRCFDRLQTSDWALRGGTTKTAYAYGETGPG